MRSDMNALRAHGLAITLTALWVTSQVAGCGPSRPGNEDQTNLPERYCVDGAKVERVASDMKLSEVNQILGIKGRHQFTVSRSTSVVVCVAYFIKSPYARFYALFDNQKFQGFVEPPAHEVTLTNYQGAQLEIEKPLDVAAQVAKVLSAERLNSNETLRKANQIVSDRRKGSSNRLGPPVMKVLESRNLELLEQYDKNDELMRHFDGSLVEFNATADDVHRILGKPDKSAVNDSKRVEIYYSVQSPKDINPLYRLSGITVEYMTNAVCAVYSGDFFEERTPQNGSDTKKERRITH